MAGTTLDVEHNISKVISTKILTDSSTLTLDEIIKQGKVKNKSKKPRPVLKKAPVPVRPVQIFTMKRVVRPVVGMQRDMDVRNKIIQGKRMKMQDARDRLAEMAKQGDARDRLNKIRKGTGLATRSSKKPAALVTKKVKRETPTISRLGENKSLKSTSKTSLQGSSLVRTLATSNLKGGTKGKKNVGLLSGSSKTKKEASVGLMDRYHPLPKNHNVVTIKNPQSNYYQADQQPLLERPRNMMMQARSALDRGRISDSFLVRQDDFLQGGGRMDYNMNQGYNRADPYSAMSRPSSNDYFSSSGRTGAFLSGRNLVNRGNFSGNMYGNSIRSNLMMGGGMQRMQDDRNYRLRRLSPESEDIRPSRLKITTVNNYRDTSPRYKDNDWDARAPQRKRSLYESEPQPQPPRFLNRPQTQQSRPATVQGFKVLVSNLHPCVSTEDMEELFGTIGPIRSVRMLSEGVAEAVFISREDAFRSVEVFNNRQLDGQPMNVTALTKKPTVNGTSSLLPNPMSATKSVLKSASGYTQRRTW